MLNPEGETLYTINIKFFEQIDDYIIPINEILEKAYELEKKYSNQGNKFVDKRISDNQLLNSKFNNNNNNNINNDSANMKKFPSLKIKYDQSHNNEIKETFEPIKLNNNLNPNINIRPYYNSTKNLMTYINFNQDTNIKNQIPNNLNNNNYIYYNNNIPSNFTISNGIYNINNNNIFTNYK